MAWGAAGFLCSGLMLAETFPMWGPYRGTLGLVGLGLALVAVLQAAGPGWLAALVVLRLATLAAAPGAPGAIGEAQPSEGAFDFATLARLQRLSAETRFALAQTHPVLPPGATVGWFHRPLMAERAFAHARALQVWYRDTTLQWVAWQDIRATPDRPLSAVLEFEPRAQEQIRVVSPASIREYLQALGDLRGPDYGAALARLVRSDSLQQDRGASVFLGTLAGRRALCLMGLADTAGARRAAEQGVRLWSDAADARFVLATLLAIEGRHSQAMAQLDTLLAAYPYDGSARDMLDSLRALPAR